MLKIILLVLLNSSFSGFSQTSNENFWMCTELKGTYQIVMHVRGIPNLPISLCTEIEQKRKDNERVIIEINSSMHIVVFSKEEIKAIDPTLKAVIYEN